MQIDFTGQTAIVTGAGRGLGRAFALDLARRGAAVVVNGRPRDEGGGGEVDSVVREIEQAGGTAIAAYASIDSPEGGKALIDTALDRFGSIDVLINNAGFLRNGAFADLSAADIDAVLGVHLGATFFVGQPAFAAMQARGYGRIVNVSSTTGLIAMPGLSNYAAAKGGVLGLTRAMAAEGAAHGILVNALVPSAIGKMQAKGAIPGFAERYQGLREQLAPRLQPETVAPLATFLASNVCQENGQTWTACAGRFARIALVFARGWIAPDADTATAEDVAAHLDQIGAIDDGIEPMTLDDIYRDIIARLPAADEIRGQ